MLFGDLVGFTTIAEGLDPEAARELLSAYFAAVRAVVERYGGVIEKFIGDAVFAIWGVPATREDDAERAVRAGLDLTSAVTAVGEELGVPALNMRVGITTGQVAVTLGAVGEGVVAGDAVNTAARVQSIAAPGQVWVDDTTRSLTTASLAYESVGSHELKGKAKPVELFHATRTTAVVGGDQRVDGLEGPFVGRDRELRLVKELFHATSEEGRPRLVLVTGEPGIGKSRLAWEFEKYVDAIPTTTTWWMRARCLSYGEGVAGRVIAELVRYLLRLTDASVEADVRQALDQRLREHVPDPAEREFLQPRLESLLGLSDRGFEQADLFACWRSFLEALPDDRASSVTIVIEDYQWADDGLRAFIDHILEVGQAPIMILVLARTEVTERHPGTGVGRRSTTVFLEPLPDVAMDRLVSGLVTNLPEAVRAELVQRAEGVPLYAVETIRALIDREIATPSGGSFVIDAQSAATLDLAAIGPPASLQALLAARLDALSELERRVVRDASVLGQSFTRAAIAALVQADADLDVCLDSLRRKEIFSIDNDPRSPERGQYRFVQALLRSVAYDTLARRDRRARHIEVARFLAAQPDAESLAGVIAAHYLDAFEAMPDEADNAELKGSAALLLDQAAQQAAMVGSPGLAFSHYDRLMALDPPDDLLVKAAIAGARLAARSGAHREHALEWAQRASQAASRLGAIDDELWVKLAAAQLYLTASNGDAALPLAREVFEQSIGRPHRVAHLGTASRLLCLCAQNSGDAEIAEQAVTAALGDIERYADDAEFAEFLDTISMWLSIGGFRRLAVVVRRAAVASENNRSADNIAPRLNLATSIAHDDPAEAMRISAEVITEGRRRGTSVIAAMGHYVASAIATGAWAQAREVIATHAAEAATELVDWEIYLAAGAACIAWGSDDASLMLTPDEVLSRDPVINGWQQMRVAVATALEGDLVSGSAIAVKAVRTMAEVEPANEDVPLGYALAVDMLAEADSLSELTELSNEFEQIAIGQRFRLLHGTNLRAAALLSDAPDQLLADAIATFEAMGAAYWAARTRLDLAAALVEREAPGAESLVDLAEPVLVAAGATRALRQVAELRSVLVP